MSNIPVKFNTTDVVSNPTLHLSYTFDKLTSLEAEVSAMPFHQEYLISCLKLNLGGRTSNPNISVSLDAVTHLFSLNCCYITDIYPHMEDQETDKSFVIEGYSTENIDKERLLIYLPMTQIADTTNTFYGLETSIIESRTNNSIVSLPAFLDLNEFIPYANSENDGYTYFKFIDNDAYIYHVIYFKNSYLQYTSALTIPANTAEYKSINKILNYIAIDPPKRHDNMTNQFEDNIYIDCVPVDLQDREEAKYLKIDDKYQNFFNEILVYITYIIIITLIVYSIYSIYIYASSKPKP
jgi:hypothetical protein